MDPEISRKVEAVLFASGRFMDATRIAELIGSTEKQVVRCLEGLRSSYAESGSALHIVNEDKAWKLHVRDAYLDVVSKVVSDTEVSGPVLETLAVIAWRSPALQSEVVDIRGSNAYEHVKELVERGFVVKEPEGRSYRLRITEKFFDYFDIEGREDIRKVFTEVEEEHRKKEMDLELEQKRLEEAIRKAESGEIAEVDLPEEPVQKKLPEKKMDIDKLDELLEKSAKTREAVGKDLAELRKIAPEEDEESGKRDDGSEESPAMDDSEATEEAADEDTSADENNPDDLPDEDDSLEESAEKAKKIREQVEADLDNL